MARNVGPWCVWGLLGGLLAGCASAPPPIERMEASVAAIRAAEELGAGQVPQAAMYLQLAKEQSEEARAAIADGERVRGEGLLMRSEADAELALALARESRARVEARQAIERIQQTRPTAP